MPSTTLFDVTRANLVVGVIGTGTMGRGIVQVAAVGAQALGGGCRVLAYDDSPGFAAKARDMVAKQLTSLAEKGRMSAADADAAIARIEIVDTLEAFAHADVVIEAIIEKLDVKQALFQKLDSLCGPNTILASNTSSLPVTAIAAKCKHPERIGGLHFFNPVPLMKLVEIIPGLRTSPAVTEALMTLGRRFTREPVLCTDSPGFIVNHAGRAYSTEMPRMLSEGIAEHHELDRVMTGAPGMKLGMFALADMVGLDINYPVQESLFQQFQWEPMYAPSPVSALRYVGGMLGQKTGQGWYTYQDGKRVEPGLRPAPAKSELPIWVRPRDFDPGLQPPLMEMLHKSGANLETGKEPSKEALIIATPIGFCLTETVTALHLDPVRTVGVDLLFGLKGPRTLMVSPATDPRYRDAAHATLAADGQPVVVINDSPGYIAQRVVAMIVNNGCNIAQRGIASPVDIDKAVKLGLGYPYGPLEWGDVLGPKRILHILECLERFYGEDRYRPSVWLKRRVALGLPLTAPEGRAR